MSDVVPEGSEESPPKPFWQRGIDRRTLLVAGGGALLLAGLPSDAPLRALLAAGSTPNLTLDLLRREDMLNLRFEFFNLQRATSGTPRLVPVDSGLQSLIAVTFPSQHVMEETTFNSSPGSSTPADPLPKAGDIDAQAVGASRIAFLVPSTVKELPYTEEGLLAWSNWVMQVVPKTAPTFPTSLQTDLLLVDWLHLTPEQYASWAHVTHPVTSGTSGRTELWHTRLAPRDSFGRPDPLLGTSDIRAVAADGTVAARKATKFESLFAYPDQADTPDQLVTQSNANGPVKAGLVLLSAQGSSVELAGEWNDPDTLPVAQWQHRSAIGRDNYVRIEKRGFLFPYGHRAVSVTETERTIGADGAAHLIQRGYIRVREPVKAFSDNGLPFRSVEIAMTTTPNLAKTPEALGSHSFWVQYTPDGQPTTDVPFPIVATDWNGNRIEFPAFLAFVGVEDLTDATTMSNLDLQFGRDTFDSDPTTKKSARRSHGLGGQKVAFAPPAGANTANGLAAAAASADVGNTTFPSFKLHMSAEIKAPSGGQPGSFTVKMLAADVRIPDVEALAGKELQTAIGYDPGYLANSFGKDKAELFLRVQSSADQVRKVVDFVNGGPKPQFTSEVGAGFRDVVAQVGGIAQPDLSIGGLSRSLGPLSGPVETISQLASAGTFTPDKLFPAGAKLLGGLSLSEVLGFDPVTKLTPTLPISSGPKIVTTPQYPNGDKTQPPEAVLTTFDWQPQLPDKLTALVFHPVLDDGTHATLTLHGENRTVFGVGGPSTTSMIKGDLRNFAIELVKGDDHLLSFIKLTFRRFAFEQHDSAKPNIHVELDKIAFEGPLNFVNTLQQFLVSTGKGLGIDVQPSGITAGYTLAIPDVGIGVFSLQHLAFSAALSLPFDGSAARARFAFCSREHPFTLSVSFFGGGGFFALALGTDGFEMMEASIEFGGAVAFNLGVASGSVSVMAGIYFKLEHKLAIPAGNGNPEVPEHDAITLSGYVRANGQLNVLGLITISAEFYLALTYTNDGGQNIVEGEASLTVEIDILFFSKSVTLSVHKSFVGPGGSSSLAARSASALPAAATPPPPKFGDQMSQDDWNTYCDAFAA